MNTTSFTGHLVLLRGACLWILVALVLAWSIVGSYNNIGIFTTIFAGDTVRLIQAHLDFLIMSALILGFYASKVELPWHVCWAMVIGAFTNSSLFLILAIDPSADPVTDSFDPTTLASNIYSTVLYPSLIITSYGFGRGSVLVLKSTFNSHTN